ncbi:MAG TPA: NTP transferase domain-containing protein, partial [Acidimicrobiales bacterium]|nr:NTP transferase domain-containing protein [Acidimicrobiales bacterium]
MTRPVAGIFVGGRALRMDGRPKGLLEAPDGGTLVERSSNLLRNLGAEIVLLGNADAYGAVGLPILADDPVDIGPLGGLVSLLRFAGRRPALALACDMPYVSGRLLQRLLDAPPA